MDTFAFSGVDRDKQEELLSLCRQYNQLKDAKLKTCAATDLVYDALDIDLVSILVQVLPIVLSLFTGGMSLPAILGLVKVVIGLFVKDADLAKILNQILETLLGFLVKG